MVLFGGIVDGLKPREERCIGGVAGGVRTLGHRNHNPALYQLSYSHRNHRYCNMR
jgi:hypothetical protein